MPSFTAGVVRLLRTPEARIAAVLAVFVFAFSARVRANGDHNSERQNLGAEYFNVARALVDGRGFSDPFGEPSGPTAWVPPVYPAMLAGLLIVLKTKSATASAVVFLTNASLIFTGTTIYGLTRRSKTIFPPWLSVGFYLCWIGAYYYWFFCLTGDIWLLMLLFDFMIILLYQYLARGLLYPWLSGILGGVALLTGPALFFGWGAVVAVLGLRGSSDERRKWLLSATISVVIAMPWGVRNAVVFRRFIPVKSNLPYELYLANVGDKDGIYDAATFAQHPFVKLEERFVYTSLGETQYEAEKQTLFVHALRSHWPEYVRRVSNRLQAATIKYAPMTPDGNDTEPSALRRGIYALPFLCLFAAIGVPGAQQRLLQVFAVFYMTYLSVYVAVAFYMRYLLPITPLLVLSVVLGVDQFVRRIRSTQPGAAGA
jgi:hypothetical protein